MLGDVLVMLIEARGFNREDEVKPFFAYLTSELDEGELLTYPGLGVFLDELIGK